MGEPGHHIRLKGHARTNTGRVRDNNEDNVDLWTQTDHMVLAVVADGMGGAVPGEEASRIAVDAVREGIAKTTLRQDQFYEGMDDDSLIDHMKEAIYKANINIVEQASAHPELKGMGTTITLALVRDNHIVVGHVGDSRAYLVDGTDSTIMQITSDHSFVQALVAAGHITEEEAEEHPMRNVLYRALGQARDVEVDIYFERLRAGDRLVLCSDGLTLHVKPDEIAEMALAEEDPSAASQELIDLANERGGRDNVSVIIIKAEADSGPVILHDVEEALMDDETVMLSHNSDFGSSESNHYIPQEPSDPSAKHLKASIAYHVVAPQHTRRMPDDTDLHLKE